METYLTLFIRYVKSHSLSIPHHHHQQQQPPPLSQSENITSTSERLSVKLSHQPLLLTSQSTLSTLPQCVHVCRNGKQCSMVAKYTDQKCKRHHQSSNVIIELETADDD